MLHDLLLNFSQMGGTLARGEHGFLTCVAFGILENHVVRPTDECDEEKDPTVDYEMIKQDKGRS